MGGEEKTGKTSTTGEKRMNLTSLQYYKLGKTNARKILGHVAPLCSLASKELSVERIRQICGDIYLAVDEFLEQVEKFEQKNKKAKDERKNEEA